MYATSQSPPRPRILCIDDEPSVSSAIAARLRSYDIEVRRAFFGSQGLWLAVTERPDVIITDVIMPNGDGEYVVSCLKHRNDTAGIPVIVISGLRDTKSRAKLLAMGIDQYIPKPLDYAKLVDALSRHVNLKKRNEKVLRPMLQWDGPHFAFKH